MNRPSFLDNPYVNTRTQRTMHTSTDYACAVTRQRGCFDIAQAVWVAAVLCGLAVLVIMLT